MKRMNFTLIELLTAMGIILLLAAILVPAVNSALKKGEVTECRSSMSALELALNEYYNTYHDWPVSVGTDGEVASGNYGSLISALQGNNTRKKNFLDVQGNNPGSFEDPWGKNFTVFLSSGHNGKISNASFDDNFGLYTDSGIVYKDVLLFSKGPKGDSAKIKEYVYSVATEFDKSKGDEGLNVIVK